MFNRVIISFLYKYFFILKAAADGWIISYIGGNKFTFCENVNNRKSLECNEFIDLYKNNLLNNIYINL